MKKPVLVVMAAGLGSRYGGLKQIDPVGSHGELIIDYSVFDARRAGFETVIFIIKREDEMQFRTAIGDRLSRTMDVRYAYQEMSDLPAGFSVPEGRVKPWGTTHAILAARDMIDGPFAVINADDYYGPSAFRLIYDYLAAPHGDGEYAMVAYNLGRTVTDHGGVTRGICRVGDDGYLAAIEECRGIEKRDGEIGMTVDGIWRTLSPSTVVSMNFWGFTRDFVMKAERMFPAFLAGIDADPMKGEFLLPATVDALMGRAEGCVKVLRSEDQWHGVTYREDKPAVVKALAELREKGLYPEKLWA